MIVTYYKYYKHIVILNSGSKFHCLLKISGNTVDFQLKKGLMDAR